MSETQMLPRHQRGRDLCHLAFRQTLDLLRVADEALEELCRECPKLPDLDSLVLRALNEMALGETEHGTRAPSHVLLAHGPPPALSGVVYAAGPGGYASVSGQVRFLAEDFPALSEALGQVTISNQESEGQSLESYQELLPAEVRKAIGQPVFNFIGYRIAGDLPGGIAAFNYPERATRYEAQLLSALAVTLGALWTLSSRVAQVEEGFLNLIGALARASEVNDEVTGDHILRVTRYAETLAQAMGYTHEEARVIGYSAQLHDVGKIHTPREVLRKPGPLGREELKIMRQHTLQGEKIIGTSPRLSAARRIAGAHHENWDGSGYPRGLTGEEIPRDARVVKLADLYDAIRSERPYKRAMTHDEAHRILTQGDARLDPSRHLDPDVLRVFREIHEEFRRIHAEIQPWG
jgi:HD-GYP domain-containing protein (c-di-GMP phosphodiesterase class II)